MPREPRSNREAGPNAARRMATGLVIAVIAAIIIMVVGLRWMPF